MTIDPLWATIWLSLLVVFGIVELVAIILKKPTYSQTTWAFFDTTWKRIAGGVFLGVLLLHFFVPPFLPGWTVAVTVVPFGYVFITGWLRVIRGEEKDMAQYSVRKGVAKGAQGVGEAWLGVLTAVGLAALVAGVDAIFPMIDEAHELQDLGLPAVLATAGVFVVRFLFNLWKVHRPRKKK
jgi:hypothetical protein